MAHPGPDALLWLSSKRLADFCVRQVVSSLACLSRAWSRVDPGHPRTLADGFRKFPPQAHKGHPRMGGNPYKQVFSKFLTQKLVPYVMRKKGIKVVSLLVSECDCVCGGACHIEGSSRHNLPSRNEQACSPLRLNYMDPMSSGRPCGELGSTTAILVPPSTNFTHLSHRYYRSLISRCAPTTSAAKRPWGAPEVNYPAVTLSVVMVRRGKQKAHVYTW